MKSSDTKTVLVTGCSSGFGYLIAKTFLLNGWNVFGTVRDLQGDGAVELSKEGVIVLTMDLSKPDTIETAIREMKSTIHTLDVLINNAGVGFLKPVEDFSDEEIRYQFEVNLFGVHRIIKEILPMMRKQKFGKIINISSMAAITTTALYGIYAATKASLESMSEALNLEVSKWNISVSLVEPGSFATKFGANAKLPTNSSEQTPYAGLVSYYTRARSQIDKKRPFLEFLRNPQRVANLVLKIAHTENPRLRYRIGVDAFFVWLATKLIPYRIRLAILRWVYRW